jgi:hypothetical protein
MEMGFMKLTREELEQFNTNIVRNAIQTPDGTILESTHQHDYVTHIDTNGESYMVDGGRAYIRRSVNTEKAKSLNVTLEDDISIIREHYTWGSYGKSGDEELSLVLLKDMSNTHIQAIVDDGYVQSPLMKLELEYRKVNNINIED